MYVWLYKNKYLHILYYDRAFLAYENSLNENKHGLVNPPLPPFGIRIADEVFFILCIKIVNLKRIYI